MATAAAEGDVVAIQLKTERREEITAEAVEVRGRNFDGFLTLFTREMGVNQSGRVIHGGRGAEVGVDDETQLFKLVENAIDGRRTDLGAPTLYGDGNLIDREVALRLGDHLGDGALGCGDAPRRSPNHRQHGFSVDASVHTGQTRAVRQIDGSA